MSGTTLTIRECLDGLLAEVVRADAAAQLLQARGWADLARGAEIAQGLDHLVDLGLHEVVLEAWLSPPSRLARFWFALRRLLGGRPQPPPFQFAPRSSDAPSLRLELRVTRSPDGGWSSTVRPGDRTANGEPIRVPRVAL